MKKYILNRKDVFDFINDNLLGTNQLSTTLIEKIDFNKGEFYTFLPNWVTNENIKNFRLGGIATGVRDYVRDKLFQNLSKNHNLTAIFDNATALYPEEKEDTFFINFGKHFNKEVYYLISRNQVTEKNIYDCFFLSNAIWHSLCVLYSDDTGASQRQLSKQYFEDISKKLNCIIIGAYDGEGYIFWESKKTL